jgi:hypothetical protein
LRSGERDQGHPQEQGEQQDQDAEADPPRPNPSFIAWPSP